MRKALYTLLVLFLISFLLFCNKKEPMPTPSDYKYEYFPLKINSWVIYDVKQRFIDKKAGLDSIATYQIMEVIESTFTDAQGRLSHRIERYRRDTDTVWTVDNVYFATLTRNAAERIEDNLRFIKLSFPPFVNKRWSGNVYITSEDSSLLWYKDWNYEYREIDRPLWVNNLFFDSVLTVSQINDTTDVVIEAKLGLEKYAKDVGLIYKKLWHLEYRDSSFPPDTHWEAKANYGFTLEMTINSYGEN